MVDQNPDSRIYVGLGYRDFLGTISWDGHMPVKCFSGGMTNGLWLSFGRWLWFKFDF